jgi:single-strand DNA-binding protein
MTTLVGRLTQDSTLTVLKDEREVVNFSIAVNDYYKARNQQQGSRLTTYFNCAYWRSSKVAGHLKKGVLVEITGRLSVKAYLSAGGMAKASLNCYVSNIKIHGSSKSSKQAAITSEAEPISEETPF